MNNKKYILTDETLVFGNCVLHRIQAIKDFGDVKAGDLGGFIESEENLSHEGKCWVCDEARVFDRALVFGEACIFDRARVYGEAQVYGDARIFGEADVYDQAFVYGKALVFGKACVFDRARVYGEASVYGEARIFGEASVYGEACICDQAHIYGNAYIYSQAHIYGEAHVCYEAKICEKADISKPYDVLCIPNIGSRNDITTFFNTRSKEIYVTCGCFKGTIDEFEKAVGETHGNNARGKAYKLAIAMANEYIHN